MMMRLPITSLDPGESYATVQDWAVAEHLARMPVAIPGMRLPDGRPFKIVLSGLSLEHRRQAYVAATDKTGGVNDDLLQVEVALRGIVEPALSRSHIQLLKDTNAHVIEQIAETIIWLTEIPAHSVRQEVERLSKLTIPDDPQSDDDVATADDA